MDFLNKTFAQLSELFKSMTPGARITTGVLVAAIVVSMAFLFRHGTSSPDYYLFGGRVLTDREIGQLQAAFSQAELNDWDTTGNRIRVPYHRRATYIAAAADANSLPDDFDTILEEMINSTSPFEPREMREMRMLYAKQRHLTMIVEAMSGIERATVKINEEKHGGLSRQTKRSALVAAAAEGNKPLSEAQVHSIRMAIAKGIDAEDADVVVTDFMGTTYGGSGADGVLSPLDNIYTATKQRIESHYQDKIAHALRMIPGVIVGVNVELDNRINQSTRTQTYNQPQPVRTTNSSNKITTRADTPQGRVGAVPNGAIANRAEEVATAAAASSGSESITDEKHEESESVIGSETVQTDLVGLTEKIVNVNVSIPQSYFRQIWLQQNPPPDGQEQTEPDKAELLRVETEELKRIEESIQRLIPGVQGGKDPWPRVYLRSYVDIKTPEPAAPSIFQQLTSWLSGNWRTLGLAAFALVSLAMVRSLAKSSQKLPPVTSPMLAATPSESEEPARKQRASDEEANSESPPQRVLKRKVTSDTPQLRNELADLVREDPDAAANIISSWIGDAV